MEGCTEEVDLKGAKSNALLSSKEGSRGNKNSPSKNIEEEAIKWCEEDGRQIVLPGVGRTDIWKTSGIGCEKVQCFDTI